jgi:hypothetical protein
MAASPWRASIREYNVQTLKEFSASCFFLLLFSVLGVVLGYGIAKILSDPFEEGVFAVWRPLNSRYTFTQILDANSTRIWARAEDGKIYTRMTYCIPGSNCGAWTETPAVKNDFDPSGWELRMVKSASCQENDWKYPRDPSPQVVECAAVYISGAEFGARIYYALLEDGSIKVWKHSSSMMQDGLLYLFVMFIGLLLGIVTFTVFMRYTGNKKSLAGSSG